MPVVNAPGGHIHLLRNGHKLWGTDEPPVQLIPDAWQEIPITIQFPDFAKSIAYGFNMLSSGPPANVNRQYAISIVKMLPAETTLPDIVLGTVSSPVINYVDWRVLLNWTKKPSLTRMSPAISPVREGKETDLRGGSGLIEIAGTWRRMIHIGLVGQNIVLSRKQSARNINENPGWHPNNNYLHPGGQPIAPNWNWTVSQLGAFVHAIQAVGPIRQIDGAAYWGGPLSASISDPTDYSSTWNGTLLVKPGRYNTSI
jgi:hypothetical protein